MSVCGLKGEKSINHGTYQRTLLCLCRDASGYFILVHLLGILFYLGFLIPQPENQSHAMNIGQTHLPLLLRFIFIDSDFNYTQQCILGGRLENIHNVLI